MLESRERLHLAPVVTDDHGHRLGIVLPPVHAFAHAPLAAREKRTARETFYAASRDAQRIAHLVTLIALAERCQQGHFVLSVFQLRTPFRLFFFGAFRQAFHSELPLGLFFKAPVDVDRAAALATQCLDLARHPGRMHHAQVIALQRHRKRCEELQPDAFQSLWRRPAVREQPAIGQIAHEHQSTAIGLPAVRIVAQPRQQVAQRIDLAVDIADDVERAIEQMAYQHIAFSRCLHLYLL